MPMIEGVPTVEAKVPSWLLALYYIVAMSGLLVWLVITLRALEHPVDPFGLLLSVLLFALCLLSVRAAKFSNIRVVADDTGMRGTRFLGRPSSLSWGEVTVISEWEHVGTFSNQRVVTVVEVHGERTSIAISDLMDGHEDFVALIQSRLAAVPQCKHRLNLLSLFIRAYRRRGIQVR